MGDWWMTAFCGMSVLALVALAAGLWLGYRWGLADREPADDLEPWPPPAEETPGEAPPLTAEWFALLEQDAAGVTCQLEQVPLGALVSPASERATGWIERITADTDRWIAGIETGE